MKLPWNSVGYRSRLPLESLRSRRLAGFRSSRPRAGQAWLAAGALGLGAGLLYLFDPNRGRRRRALIRDQITHAAHKASDGARVTARDLGHRTRGLWARASRLF
jgi:hypothetical protein